MSRFGLCPACGDPRAEIMFHLPRCPRGGCRFFDLVVALDVGEAKREITYGDDGKVVGQRIVIGGLP